MAIIIRKIKPFAEQGSGLQSQDDAPAQVAATKTAGATSSKPPTPSKNPNPTSGSPVAAKSLGTLKATSMKEIASQPRSEASAGPNQAPLTRKGAANFLTANGYPTRANRLAKMAVTGEGPGFYLYGGRAYYKPEVLLAWSEARTVVVPHDPNWKEHHSPKAKPAS